MAVDAEALRRNVERWRADGGVCAKEYVRDVEALLEELASQHQQLLVANDALAAERARPCVDYDCWCC